ncbi:MAG: polysaccharide pyruvyl transferase family protein [Nostoc sp. ChiSLP02]|nr:polysaccharide pyruvyl transferase family protein [Nostoc sp. DedSLP05]MDZ8102293.1 polysaccharide pyruvyl transferase family protein [Nostoc sp. DedSLP01]MDZ8187298.1 polysaccharide pyruvyl transferase family protein [Nostoc sp. ChiSLP02]
MSLKIGIITYHFTTNYGASLQAYALSHFLMMHGHDVEFIDYRPKSIRLEERRYLYNPRYLVNPNLLLQARRKRINMSKFLGKHIKLSKKIFYTDTSLNEYKHSYDIVICGSDEIWNVNSPRGLDKPYFINFINGEETRKISYAASFGSTNTLGLHEEEIHSLLKDFHAIAVRDNNSLSLINQAGLNIKKVVDPTLLLNLVNYENLLRINDIKSKYILVYGYMNQKEAEYVKILSDKEGLDIISVGFPQKYLKPFLKLNLFDAAPEEWLGYFYNASFVATNFFHGVVFSIIFNKPFTAFSNPQKVVKIREILNPLGIENRLLDLSKTSDFKISDRDLLVPLLTEDQKNNLNQQIQFSKDYLLHEALN